MKKLYIVIPLLIVMLTACSEDSTGPSGEVESAPQIVDITANKTEIKYGGEDPCMLTCNATGGNLKYVWKVDLGDLIPQNSSHSQVSFNGSACCVGEKTITCTVSNSMGSVTESIVITILEELKQPVILTMESEKQQISADKGEVTDLVCYAIGGELSFEWSADCGEIVVDEVDPYKATLTATPGCIGTTTVTCKVSNAVGSADQSITIAIVN